MALHFPQTTGVCYPTPQCPPDFDKRCPPPLSIPTVVPPWVSPPLHSRTYCPAPIVHPATIRAVQRCNVTDSDYQVFPCTSAGIFQTLDFQLTALTCVYHTCTVHLLFLKKCHLSWQPRGLTTPNTGAEGYKFYIYNIKPQMPKLPLHLDHPQLQNVRAML